MPPQGEHHWERRRVQHLAGDAADGEPAERSVPGRAHDDERRVHLGGCGDEALGGRGRGPGHVLRPHGLPDDLAGLGDRPLGVAPQELGVLGVHTGQGRVSPHLRKDHTHDEGDVPGLGQHSTQGEGILPAPVGGEPDEVPHRPSPCQPAASVPCCKRSRSPPPPRATRRTARRSSTALGDYVKR